MSLLIGASSGLQGAAGASAGGAADLGDTINQSLRFRDSTLSKTLTNHTSFTASMWIKRGLFGTEQTFFEFSAADADLRFTANDELKYYDNATSGTSDMRFRDPSAWYHIVLAYDQDGSGGLGSDTVRVYVNGADSGLRTSAGGNSGGGSTVLGSSAFEGYIAEFNYVQSTQLPTAFGKYNEDNVWVPITFEGTYGAQGVHLVFDNSAGIGDDTSGNGNDFTASGFNTTAIGSSNKHNDIDFNDTPTSNYGTLNSEGSTTGQFADFANLHFTSTSPGTWQGGYGTFPMQSGKWYWEYHSNGANGLVGISSNHQSAPSVANATGEIGYQLETGNIRNAGSSSSYGATAGSGDVIGIAFDADNGTIWFSKNDTWLNSATQSEVEAGTTTNAAVSGLDTNLIWVPFVAVTREDHFFNFGQMNFLSTKPSGYEALNTNKTAQASIKNPSDHFRVITGPGSGSVGSGQREAGAYSAPHGFLDNNFTYHPSKGFDGSTSTQTYVPRSPTGDYSNFIVFDEVQTGSTIRVNAFVVGGKVIANGTDVSGSSGWIDISSACSALGGLKTLGFVSGAGQGGFGAIEIDSQILIQESVLNDAQDAFSTGAWLIRARTDEGNDAQDSQWQWLDSTRGGTTALTFPFNTSGTSGCFSTTYADPSNAAFAYCWNSSEPATNGFQIIQDTSPTTGNNVISHSLGKTPEFIFSKETGNSDLANIYHVSLGTTHGLTNAGDVEHTNAFRVTAVSSSSFTMADSESSKTQIHYVWTSIEGFSKFGEYNSATPYVYTGFKPALLWIKKTGVAESWYVIDGERNPHNPMKIYTPLNSQGAELTSSGDRDVDFLSNGFRIRGTDSQISGSAQYVYMCWAEQPFGGSNVPPATAR